MCRPTECELVRAASSAEVFRKRAELALVVGAALGAIQDMGRLHHALKSELTDALKVVNREWHFVGSEF